MGFAELIIQQMNSLSMRKLGSVFLFLGRAVPSRFRDEILDDQGKMGIKHYKEEVRNSVIASIYKGGAWSRLRS